MGDWVKVRGEFVGMLAGGPGRIAAATVGLPAERLRQEPGPGEWSAVEVLAHLRACADVWGGSIQRILAEDEPTIRAVNPRTWIERTDYRELEFRPSLAAFTVQRAALVELLEGLAAEQWERSATVTGAGRPLVRSVHGYVEWLAVHERPHLKQIERIAKVMAG